MKVEIKITDQENSNLDVILNEEFIHVEGGSPSVSVTIGQAPNGRYSHMDILLSEIPILKSEKGKQL